MTDTTTPPTSGCACAHSRVVRRPIHHPGGTTSDSWVCSDNCGTEFVPAREAERLRAELAELTAAAEAEVDDAEADMLDAHRQLDSLKTSLAPLLAGRPPTPENVAEAVGHAARGCLILARMIAIGATGFGARRASLLALQSAGKATGAMDCTQALLDLSSLETEADKWLSADAALSKPECPECNMRDGHKLQCSHRENERAALPAVRSEPEGRE